MGNAAGHGGNYSMPMAKEQTDGHTPSGKATKTDLGYELQNLGYGGSGHGGPYKIPIPKKK